MTISVRVSDEEYHAVYVAAQIAEASMSDVVRDCLWRCGFKIAHREIDNVMTSHGKYLRMEAAKSKETPHVDH